MEAAPQAHSPEKVVLHYFGCRGLGQPIRYMLEDSGIAWDEVIVQNMGEYVEKYKDDAEFSGAFGSMPVLKWGGWKLSQSSTIERYLDKKLGYATERSLEAEAIIDMVATAVHMDLSVQFLMLLWGPISFAGADIKGLAQNVVKKAEYLLPKFEALLGDSAYFSGSDTVPSHADFLFFEAFDLFMQYIWDAPTIQARWPRLHALHARIASRPRIAEYLASGRRPVRITESAVEQDVLALVKQ